MSDNRNEKKAGVVNTRLSALDPRNGVLAQPFKRLVEEGFVTKICVEFTPNGYTAFGVPDSRLAAVDNSGLTEGQQHPVAMLSNVAEKGNLIPRGKTSKNKTSDGPAQPLPKKTLCKKDFEGSEANLIARCKVVASESGGGTLIGRVRSAGKFEGDCSISYQDWWKTAHPMCRAISLCLTKTVKDLTREQIAKLAAVPCPFRGDAEFIVAQNEEDAKEQVKPAPNGTRTPSPKK